MRRAAAALVLATACSSSPGAPATTVTVFAASSLTATFTQLAKGFERAHPGTTVRLSFGPSSGLAQQVVAGAPADVFASASPKTMQQVVDAGDATAPTTFARNVAQVAVAPGSSTTVTSLADLAKRGVRVALCAPQVPCGALTQEVLARARVAVRPVTLGLDVKSTLAYVTGGQVDAAVVYATDVLAAGSEVVGVTVPAEVNSSTAYEIATVTSSRHRALARAFEQYVLSRDGQAALARAGFQKP